MTLPATGVFEQTLLSLPSINSYDYSNLASWVAQNTDKLMWLTGILPTTNTVFTFNQATFKTTLASLTPTASINSGANGFFGALETAVLASNYRVSPGAYVGSSSPATTWSTVVSTVPDPLSLAAAKSAAISYMVSAQYSLTNPILANSVRIYFTTLTYTVTGTNSAVPPVPLVAAAVKVF